MNFQILDWDSDFFGINVARINEPDLSIEALTEILKTCSKNNIKLIYWPSSREMDQDAIRKLGGLLADRKTTFLIDLEQFAYDDRNSTCVVEPYMPTMPIPDMVDLAIQSGEYSRFSVDPHIPNDKFKALYTAWMRRSLSKEIASEVLVVQEAGKVIGMVTLGEKEKRADIGLIAVNTNYRGRKIGETLVRASQMWSIEHGYKFAQVVTQGSNAAACSLYKKCDYALEKVEFFYHFWL